MRDYPKLSIEEFGRELLVSGDLDPVYIALHLMQREGDIDKEQLYRWILAYILCYHCGCASYLSEFAGNEFFQRVMIAATNLEQTPLGGRWPRSSERRHWRGKFAEEVVAKLHFQYGDRPEQFVENIAFDSVGDPYHAKFSEVAKRVSNHHGFSHWASFKLADLIDRVGIQNIDFSFHDVVIYKDPVLAAEMVYRQKNGLPDNVKVKPEGIKAVFDYLIDHFSDYTAPPLFDRKIGVQESESQLCKYKSHLHGHYPLYNDIREIHHGLTPWAEINSTAKKFQLRMPVLPI